MVSTNTSTQDNMIEAYLDKKGQLTTIKFLRSTINTEEEKWFANDELEFRETRKISIGQEILVVPKGKYKLTKSSESFTIQIR